MAKHRTDESLTVVICHRYVMLSQGLRVALDQHPGISVVGVASSLNSALELIDRERPNVVLLGFVLPDAHVADAVKAIRATSHQPAVVVLSPFSDYDSVRCSLEAGAAGYLLKEQPIEELSAALLAARDGGHPLAPRLVSALVERLTRTTTPAQQLSRREIEVLRHLADGNSTALTASLLGLSINTVRNHVQSAIRRLGAHSKLEAVAIAQRESIIGPARMPELSRVG